MKFGVCIPGERSAAFATAGWDYVEEVVTSFLQGTLADADWDGLRRARGLSLPIPAANRLLPATLKVTGPHVDAELLGQYMKTVVDRAAAVGITLLVFGSGPARSVPEGFDRGTAREQILKFIEMATGLCAAGNITLLAEPMNRGESNIINSVSEAMEYVRAIDHANFQCLFDSYHFWLENEPIENLRAAMPWIRHVHLADVEGRRAPGQTGVNDYRPIFEVLREARYDGLVTVESNDLLELPDGAARVLKFLKDHAQENSAC